MLLDDVVDLNFFGSVLVSNNSSHGCSFFLAKTEVPEGSKTLNQRMYDDIYIHNIKAITSTLAPSHFCCCLLFAQFLFMPETEMIRILMYANEHCLCSAEEENVLLSILCM